MDFAPDPRIAEILARQDETAFTGSVWKHTFSGQAPDASNTKGARWNPSGVPALYLALERNTAVAEGDYLASQQPQPIRTGRQLHELSLRVDRVLDLRDRQVLRNLGVSDTDLGSANHEACRRVGGTAEWLGCGAIIVPSARANGSNLVVFPRRASPEFDLELVSSASLAD